jgi:hypothetical protein
VGITSFPFVLMAAIAAVDTAWSPTLNTGLLIILGIVTYLRERTARAERTQIQKRTIHITKALSNVEQKLTTEHRDPKMRTRQEDEEGELL